MFYRPQFTDSDETLDSDDSQINLLILGSGGFAQEMEREIQVRLYCIAIGATSATCTSLCT